MSRPLLTAALIVACLVGTGAAPSMAGTRRYLAYDAADRITMALTRGVTLEVESGLFGALSLRRIISTTARGSSTIDPGGPEEARYILPREDQAGRIYTVPDVGDGRPLARALCPGADRTYLIVPLVRAVRPLTIHAVGRWADGRYRSCVTLSYSYRGEWALPPRSNTDSGDGLAGRP